MQSSRFGRLTRDRVLAPLTIVGVSSLLAFACTAEHPPKSSGLQARAANATPPATQAPPADAGRRGATVESHGFNDAIAWRGFEEGFREAAEQNRPLMLVVHASWCSKCRLLKRKFRTDQELIELSEQFVMVNVDQDHEPSVTRLGPDGTYLPRVLFFAPNGDLDATLQNPGRGRFRYFYMPHEDLIGTMRRALERHGAPAREHS
ncbi:MAG: thioredoxin family protein [Myxococcales bacterium]|nr:thioredoxin family protein [Myxococcales bacterium]